MTHDMLKRFAYFLNLVGITSRWTGPDDARVGDKVPGNVVGDVLLVGRTRPFVVYASEDGVWGVFETRGGRVRDVLLISAYNPDEQSLNQAVVRVVQGWLRGLPPFYITNGSLAETSTPEGAPDENG